jgi:Na+-transporting methylmalonyl-CoA/oxaloacetate decarboxylase gamma subunit
MAYLLGLTVILVVLVALAFAAWHVGFLIHRHHKLSRQLDERENKRLMAEDFAAIRRELNEALPFSFEEYSAKPKVLKRTNNEVD